MKIFRKTGVAVLLTVLMIAAAIGIGRWRGAQAEAVPPPSSDLDTSLSASTYLNWISDGADVLSEAQENQIALYNANWVERYDSLIAVATVSSLSEDIGDYAYNLGVEIELASADGILVVNAENGDCYLAVGADYPMTDSQVSSYLDRYLYEDAMAGNFGVGVLSLFDGINEFYLDNYGLGYLDNSGDQVYGGRSAGEMLGAVVVLLVILLVIASVLDSMRYTSYRQRYYGVPNPPYVFRPILFWHGPGWGWYRRRWRRPPPPPPRGPRGPGGRPGGGGFNGFQGPGGFGGSGGSRGGGFSGGTILGAGLILFSAAFGHGHMRVLMNQRRYSAVRTFGLLLYGILYGIYIFIGANDLPNYLTGMILLIDLAVGLVVACTMYGFYALFSRGEI